MHQIPTEEALLLARLHEKEHIAQGKRDHLASTANRPARPHIVLPSPTTIPVGLALQMVLLTGLLVGLIAVAAG